MQAEQLQGRDEFEDVSQSIHGKAEECRARLGTQ